MALESYEWIVVCGALAAFAMAWGIGANDVANAFATSVGSKALTLRQATLIAAVFEFAGALGLGASVTKTISGGIASSSVFKNDPEVLMYGMLCALVAASAWLYIATYLSLPVSTTHSIVGGVLGMTLVYGGSDAVIWWDKIDEFPFRKGVGIIMVSWITSPVCAGLLSFLFFFSLRAAVLRSRNPVRMGVLTLPIVIFFVIWAYVWFILAKGVTGRKKFGKAEAVWIAAVTAAGAAGVAALLMPVLKKRVMADGAAPTKADDMEVATTKQVAVVEEAPRSGVMGFLTRGVDVDIHKGVDGDRTVSDIHDNAEKFDPKAEAFYKYCQIFSACCDAFAHGANDVANSIGPFAAIYGVYKANGKVSGEFPAPEWILVLGGFGIVVGLATYGYNIMRALGVQTVKITPSRGFCVEMSTAMIVAVGSALGIPLSTTQCQVGGTWGVGLAEGHRGINWLMSVKFFLSWILTLFLTCGMSAALFAQGVYSPTLQKEVKIPSSKPKGL